MESDTSNLQEDPVRGIVARIAEAIHPERVILFGSRAFAESSPESDIDLVVVCKDEERPRDVQVAIHRLFRRPSFSLDVFVYRSGDFEVQRRVANTIAREAFEKGRVCYG